MGSHRPYHTCTAGRDMTRLRLGLLLQRRFTCSCFFHVQPHADFNFAHGDIVIRLEDEPGAPPPEAGADPAELQQQRSAREVNRWRCAVHASSATLLTERSAMHVMAWESHSAA